MAIWQDLVDDHGFPAQYASVRRFVRKLRGAQRARGAPGDRDRAGRRRRRSTTATARWCGTRTPGKYRRTRLFVFTLGYSRKSVRLLTFASSTRSWAELHEEAFRRLGGAVRVVVLDNLREGVLTPDIYDPTLNPLYRDVLAHYGAVALPCRVGDPDRKGKVESAIGHAQARRSRACASRRSRRRRPTSTAGTTRWADTRIHGTTKRQVAAMFAEERPRSCRCRSSRFATTSTARARCISTAASRSTAPTTARRPAGSAARSPCSGTSSHVRLLDPRTGQLLREHRRQSAAATRIHPDDRPARTPPTHADAAGAGRARRARTSARSARRSTAATASSACAASSASSPRQEARRRGRRRRLRRRPGARRRRLPLRPALSRTPPAGPPHAAPGRPAHPRPHPLPRRHRAEDPGGDPDMNLVELQRALRQLRCSGMAAGLEPRLLQAQTEKLAPIDFLSTLVGDELAPPPGPAARAPHQAGRLPRRRQDASTPSTSTSTRR